MFFFFWGFLVWLGASLIFRLLGEFFFNPNQMEILVASYILVIPVILMLTLPIFKWKKVKDGDRLKAAVLIALPGMFIDVLALLCFAIEKCRKLQRKIQSVATQYFPYFLDNALVKRKLWPVYEIIWAW